MKKIYFPVALLSLFLMSCGGWTDARKQTISDKCIDELYDCDCYVTTIMDVFQDPELYNKVLEDTEANKDKYEEYMSRIKDCELPEPE